MTEAADVERAKREAVATGTVRVRWTCLRIVKGRALCMGAREDTHTASEWERRRAASKCPKCGGALMQTTDGCEVVP